MGGFITVSSIIDSIFRNVSYYFSEEEKPGTGNKEDRKD
jgi:hypothetical protein